MIQVTQYLPMGNGSLKRTAIEVPEKADPVEILALAARHGRIWTPEEDAARERGWQEVIHWRGVSAREKEDAQTPQGFTYDKENARPLAVPQEPMSAPAKPDMFAPTVGVRETSLVAYEKIKWNGTMTAQQKIVMDWLRGRIGDASRSEIEKGTGLKINAVTGRVHELIELGALTEAPKKRKCRVTGETVNAVVVAP